MNKALRVQDYLGHILQAIDRIDGFSAGLNEVSFMADLKTQDAVIRNLEVIGEACSNIRKLAPAFTKAHPEVPWGSAIGNRNALSHGYFSVDLSLIWATMQNDLPALKASVERLDGQDGR
ncbi:DUF86 domain-containing protein [Rhodoferax ferrireducens]|uniref:HepT-like ribonuclease domain-containing protein n=1 Tax=Rhodoferax ferrireducens TaxID=192843 RepID=UPI000E0DAB2E|nr:DUF86 domain-containing protein [Rhodoferax ferrireducens]